MNLNNALAVRSDFSVGESLLQIEHIVECAKEHGYETVALVDNMSLNGMIAFSSAAKKAGIKPITGVRLNVFEDPTDKTSSKKRPRPMFALKAYAKDETGVKALIRLLSKANSEENFYYVPRIGLNDILSLEGVIVTTGDMNNLFHSPAAYRTLKSLIDTFGIDDVFVELVPINTPLFDTLNAKALKLAKELGAETLVTYPFAYKNKGDADSLDVLSVITSVGMKMDTSYRNIQYVQDFNFQPPAALINHMKLAIQRIYKWNGINNPTLWAKGIANTERLAAMCNYQFKKQDVCLPKMADDEFKTLTEKCVAGWKRRFTTPVLGYSLKSEDVPKYRERLSFELNTLKNMGFSGYFLLVEDLVNWSKENGIMVGPGRGSVGGSLVAYLLGITDVDPIRFNLLFERFINPERLDLPDADLDFASEKRHLVIEYLTGKYGADRVAGISNYSTLGSASALRDTGRVYGLGNIELSPTKLVPAEHGQSASLVEAARQVPEIEKFRDTYPMIWKHALKFEGVLRNFGKHAAGIIVAGEPLVNRAVVETRSEQAVVNWDKRVVEDMGLVKMDILGLSTLDVLEIAKQYIKERHGKTIDYLKLPLDEPDVMDAFGRGDTTGVFQFESSGMKGLLRNLAKGGRLTFDDVTAATALYRPGPMDSGLMDDYIQIKQGNREVAYDHPNLENALKDTYGVIVYQEQVMQAAVDLAGFTRAEADGLRKAMGKKDADKMAEMRDKWVAGCKAVSAMDERASGTLFDKIQAFAAYGFNKSHAVEYSIISVWTMWLRVRYPAEYFAACMSIVKEDKLPGLVKDARECGIEVLPPDINKSSDRFTIPDDKHILAPFSAVKGISQTTALRIVELRESNRDWKTVVKRSGREETVLDETSSVKGRFDSPDEFAAAAATPGSKVNARVVESLGLVGAYASIDKTAKSARHPDRRKDQMELMPGLIIDAITVGRTTDLSVGFAKIKIADLVRDYKMCDGCDLAGQQHPTVRHKNNVKFMVVTDCPTWQEEKAQRLLEGDAADYIKSAIKASGLSVADGYYTSLVKAKKNDKFLTNGQLNGCRCFIERELELIKPGVIVALGSAAIKHFVPGHKGSTAELVGKVIYDAKLDANIVCGLNAAQCAFDSTKVEVLFSVFEKVGEILS